MKVKLLEDYPLHRDRKSKQKYEQRQCFERSISPLIAPPSKKKKDSLDNRKLAIHETKVTRRRNNLVYK